MCYTETHEGAGIHPRGIPWRVRAVVFSSVVLPDPSHCTITHLDALSWEQLPELGGFLAALSRFLGPYTQLQIRSGLQKIL